jgi:nucleotide-binding universal stress UspA family protein
LVIGIEAPRPIGAGGEQSPDPAEASLRFAFARADRLRVPLIAVHAVEIAGVDRAAREGIGDCIAAEQAPLETRLRPWRAAYPDVEVMLRCVAGTPRRALTDAARYAQLTVLSRRADDSLPARHLGPTARGFMHQARRPVALVPELPVRSSA